MVRLSTAGAVVGKYATGRGSFGVAAQGENVWITNYFDKTVTKLRAADGVNLGTFKVGDGAAGVMFDGTNLWVVCNGDSTLLKIAPASINLELKVARRSLKR